MSHVLSAKERQALDRMTIDHTDFHIKAKLGTGVGAKTIESLLELGLIEAVRTLATTERLAGA